MFVGCVDSNTVMSGQRHQAIRAAFSASTVASLGDSVGSVMALRNELRALRSIRSRMAGFDTPITNPRPSSRFHSGPTVT